MIKRNGRSRKPMCIAEEDRFRLTYFDFNWNELEHLCLPEARFTEVVAAITTWMEYRDQLRFDKAPLLHSLAEVTFICVEVVNG